MYLYLYDVDNLIWIAERWYTLTRLSFSKTRLCVFARKMGSFFTKQWAYLNYKLYIRYQASSCVRDAGAWHSTFPVIHWHHFSEIRWHVGINLKWITSSDIRKLMRYWFHVAPWRNDGSSMWHCSECKHHVTLSNAEYRHSWAEIKNAIL